MVRHRFIGRELFFALFGLITGLLLLFIWLSPRVVETGKETLFIPVSGPIVVTLNRPPAVDSVAEHFAISPEITGSITVDDRRIIFQPDEPFSYGENYTVSIDPGIRSLNGLPGIIGSTLSYVVQEPRLVFLLEQDGRSNVWLRQPSGEITQLTDEPGGVWDFQVLPDSRGIIYSAINNDGGSDLVQLSNEGDRDIILECPAERCTAGHWQPAGSLLAFVRTPSGGGIGPMSEVWILDTANGNLAPAIESEMLEGVPIDRSSFGPRWSADGRYLTLFQPEVRLVIIQDKITGSSSLVPANLDMMSGWSPVAEQLVYTELVLDDPDTAAGNDHAEAGTSPDRHSLYSHVTLTDLATEAASDLTVDHEANYGNPSWHPDGEHLAVPRGNSLSPRQIWLLPVDGNDPLALTDAPTLNHSSLAWSPDGRQLAFMGNDVDNSGQGPAVWQMDSVTGQTTKIIEGAYLPAWLP